jgi:hypothetical protein
MDTETEKHLVTPLGKFFLEDNPEGALAAVAGGWALVKGVSSEAECREAWDNCFAKLSSNRLNVDGFLGGSAVETIYPSIILNPTRIPHSFIGFFSLAIGDQAHDPIQ